MKNITIAFQEEDLAKLEEQAKENCRSKTAHLKFLFLESIKPGIKDDDKTTT